MPYVKEVEFARLKVLLHLPSIVGPFFNTFHNLQEWLLTEHHLKISGTEQPVSMFHFKLKRTVKEEH